MELPNAARSYRKDGEVNIKGLLRPHRTPQEVIYSNLFDIEMAYADRHIMYIARALARQREFDFWNVKLRDPGLWVNGKQVLKF